MPTCSISTMKENRTNSKKVNGFSLVEMLIYVALLGVVLAVIAGSLLIISQSQERVSASRAIDRSATFVLDRVLREVRMSSFVNTDESVFGESESVLVVVREDGGSSVRFSVEDGELSVEMDGETLRLTHRDVEVDRFFVEHIETEHTEGVRVELDLRRPYRDGEVEQSFYGTALSRGSYAR